jgi:hypothetical protein
MNEPQKPTVGRIVHIVIRSACGAIAHRAAIVVNNPFGTLVVDLTVFGCPTDFTKLVGPPMFYAESVTYDETGSRPGSWHWPEREL